MIAKVSEEPKQKSWFYIAREWIRPTKKANYESHIVSFYQKMAKKYDKGLSNKKIMRKNAVKMSKVRPWERVLDVCTGTGEAAAWFAREGTKVTGIDLSPHMLAIAKVKYPDITFKVMDASKLDFPDKSFDVVNIQLGLHDMPVPIIRKTLRELKRVAYRAVIIAEPQVPKNRFFKVIFRYIAFTEFFEAADWKGYTNLDLEKEIQKAGLKIEEVRSLDLGFLRIYKSRPNSLDVENASQEISHELSF